MTLEQIQTVKDYRNRTGCTLRQAVDAVRGGATLPPSEIETLRSRLAAAEGALREIAECGHVMLGGFGCAVCRARARSVLSGGGGREGSNDEVREAAAGPASTGRGPILAHMKPEGDAE